MNRFSTFCYALALFGGVSAVAAIAADQSVHQKGRVFSVEAMKIKAGDAVVFVNDDTVPHNVMSTSTGNEFNLGSIAPGTAMPVKFDKAGTVQVICAIHPRMKMTVTVD